LYECVADAGRAIKLADSDAIDALNLRGQAYYRLGEHEMALNHWRKVPQAKKKKKRASQPATLPPS